MPINQAIIPYPSAALYPPMALTDFYTLKERFRGIFEKMLSPREYQRQYEFIFGNSNAPPPIKLPIEYEMEYYALQSQLTQTLIMCCPIDAITTEFLYAHTPWLPKPGVIDSYYYNGSYPEDIAKERMKYCVSIVEPMQKTGEYLSGYSDFKLLTLRERLCQKAKHIIRRVKDVFLRNRL